MSFPITYGKKSVFKRNIFQGVLSKTDSKYEAEKIVDFFKTLDPKCMWIAICYRLFNAESTYEEEEGAGPKLLGLLKRMNISEVVLGVRIWPDINIAQHDTFRMMLNSAKEIIIENVMFSQETEKPAEKIRRINVVELETLPPEPEMDYSFSFISKKQFSKPQIDSVKAKLASITQKINENDIKALQEFINHTTIGKILLILLVLLQKKKPTVSLAKQFYMHTNVKALIEKLDPLTLPKIQIQRAKKLFKKVSNLHSSHFEKISKCSALIFQYIKLVLALNTSNTPALPTVQSNLLSKKGEYLKSKHVVFSYEKEIVPEEIPEKSESEETPEPDGLEKLKGIGGKTHKNLAEFYSEIQVEGNFKDERFKKARVNRLEEEALITRLIKLDPDEIDPDVKIDFNLNEEEIIKFLATEDLESKPTDLLLKLADKLKERRERHSLA